MPKFNTLTKPILIEILKAHELAVDGTRADMCERLNEHLGVEDIDPVVLQNILETPQNDTQIQINALKKALAEVLGAVEKLSTTSTNNINTSIGQTPGVTNAQYIGNSVTRTEVTAENDRSSPTTNTTSSYQTAEGCVRTSMRDVIAVLPEFDPSKAHPTSKQFITKVENLMISYGWAEKIVLYAVQGVLKGHAKTWIDSQDVFESWVQFVEAFQKDFPYVENIADIHVKMMNSKQVKNEKLIDFYYKILAIGRQGKLDDCSIIRHVINGIHEEAIRKTLNAMQFNTCSEFLKALTGIASTVKTNVDENYRFFQRERNTSVNNEKSHGPKDAINNKSKTLICYNCNEPGHISARCPRPQKKNRCPSCNKVHASHEPADCGKKTVTSRRIQVGDQIFIKKIYVNNIEWSAFVDTGSQCSMVRRAVADKLSDKREKCSLTIQGIAGGQRNVNEVIKTSLEVDGINVVANLYVVDDDIIEEDMLLGQDIFDDHKMKAVVENGKIRFQVARVDIQQENISIPECEHLNDNDYQKLATLLNTYRDRFATGLGDIGKTDLVTLRIELDTNTPIAQPPYRVPYPKRAVISKMVDELLNADIVQTSESEYASPITLCNQHP